MTKKRPPRQVWLVWCDGAVLLDQVFTKRAEAASHAKKQTPYYFDKAVAVGPFVLAERVSNADKERGT